MRKNWRMWSSSASRVERKLAGKTEKKKKEEK
jgi:hypothetical protein